MVSPLSWVDSIRSKLTQLPRRLSGAPRYIRATSKTAISSGLLWEFSTRGSMAAVRTLLQAHQNPSDIYRVHAQTFPDRIAVEWRDETLTFGELESRIVRLANGLAERGLVRKQSVLSLMRNRPEHLEVQNAVARLGASAVAISWRSTQSELTYLAVHSGAHFIFFEHDLAKTVLATAAEIGFPRERLIAIGGDVPHTVRYEEMFASRASKHVFASDEAAAVVTYTSGTTGKPKGAVRRFPKDALVSALEFIAETPMVTSDVHLTVCPLYHMTAYGFLTFAHLLGSKVVIADEFKPEAFLSWIEKYEVSTTALVPTMLHRVVALGPDVIARYRTRSLRAIFCVGAPLTGQLANQAMDLFGDVVFNCYGATETGLVTLAKPADLRIAGGTIGRALPFNRIALLDDQKESVKQGEIGELFVKNDLLVSEYHHDQEATRASMTSGYFSVGDLARENAAGLYFIEGRKRDMVITGGVNVYPAEIEATLEEHPAVFEAAVVGIADAEWGERVKAFVVLREGMALDEGALKTYLREKLAGPKVPKEISFIASLPRNPTGKVLKRELREELVANRRIGD